MNLSRHQGTLAACLLLLNLYSITTHAVAVSGQGIWETTLLPRDLDDDDTTVEAYYDTVLGITWLANANANGNMNWAAANNWATGLNFNGVTGWRLPTTVDVGNDGATYTNIHQGVDYGYNITTHSEMSHMYYVTLGNTAWYDTSGNATGCIAPDYCLSNTGPFTNLLPHYYWSSTEYALTTNTSWLFMFNSGWQKDIPKVSSYYAWAVHNGDVGTGTAVVPVPAAAWLFGSGLLCLVGVARKKAA